MNGKPLLTLRDKSFDVFNQAKAPDTYSDRLEPGTQTSEEFKVLPKFARDAGYKGLHGGLGRDVENGIRRARNQWAIGVRGARAPDRYVRLFHEIRAHG